MHIGMYVLIVVCFSMLGFSCIDDAGGFRI